MRLSTNLSTLLLATSLVFTGCKKDNAAAPSTGSATPTKSIALASDDDYVKAGTALVDKMLGIFKADGTNCDKLAVDITKLASDNAEAIKASQAYEKAHPEAKKKFDEATKAQQTAFETLGEPLIAACKDNQKFTDALNKLIPE